MIYNFNYATGYTEIAIFEQKDLAHEKRPRKSTTNDATRGAQASRSTSEVPSNWQYLWNLAYSVNPSETNPAIPERGQTFSTGL